MSLLSIVQGVAEEAGVESPQRVVGQANDEIASRLLALTQREGKRLARSHDWSALHRTGQVLTRRGQASYKLPDDFDHLVSDTTVNSSDGRVVFGPATSAQWASRKAGVAIVSRRNRTFTLAASGAGREITIDPTPSDSDLIEFGYISSHWVVSPDSGQTRSEWGEDADEPIVDGEVLELGVLWRFLNRMGLAYAEEKAEYQRALDVRKARDGGAQTISFGRLDSGADGLNIPETGFGSASAGSSYDERSFEEDTLRLAVYGSYIEVVESLNEAEPTLEALADAFREAIA